MEGTYTRRVALRFLGLSAAAGVLAACGPNAPAVTSPTSAAASAGAPTSAPPAATPAGATSGGAPTSAPAAPANAPAAATVSVSQPTAASAAASGAQPKRGGSLKVGQIGDSARLDG